VGRIFDRAFIAAAARRLRSTEDAGRGAGDKGDEAVEKLGDLAKGAVLEPVRSLQGHPKGCLVLPLIHVPLPWMRMRSS
jgi:hypothetical protein